MTCVFVANISNEFILRMDVLHAHDASVDLVWHVLQTADEEVSLWCPGVRLHSSPYMKRNSEVAATWCGRDVAACLEDSYKHERTSQGQIQEATHSAEYVGART
jgi:hypothetical protein